MKVLMKIYEWVFKDRWSLGFIEEPLDDIVNGKPYSIHYVTGIKRDRWYADPFILEVNDNTIELLVEEWRYKNNKGRIAKLIIDRFSYKVIDEFIILELNTHLSFPFIKRVDNKVYVFPENSFAGKWDQYIYQSKENKLSKIKTIVQEPLTDAVITDAFEKELIFSTKQPDACGKALYIFSIDGEIIQEIELDSRVARGAGEWFQIGKSIYRPAQDCNGGYGKAVIIQNVQEINGAFTFTNVCRIESTHPNFKRGLHTLNHYKGLTVVDVCGFKHRFLGGIACLVKSNIQKLLHLKHSTLS